MIAKSNPFPGNWISKIEKIFQNPILRELFKNLIFPESAWFTDSFTILGNKKNHSQKKVTTIFNFVIQPNNKLFSSKNSSQFTPSLPTTIPMISPATTVSPLALVSSSKFGKINRFQIIWNFSWKTAQDTTISMILKVMQMHHFHSSR